MLNIRKASRRDTVQKYIELVAMFYDYIDDTFEYCIENKTGAGVDFIEKYREVGS